MKKSQRARLAELTNKAEADRSAVEKAEFGFLSALATAHPDASKDIDDTSPAAAANATPPPTAAASPAAGANAPPPAAATPPAASGSNPPATFRGFIQSLRTGAQTGAELVTARQSVTTLTTERDQARQQVATLTAQVNAFAAFFGITAAELAGKPAADVTALIQQKISDQALEQVAAIGVPVNQLPKQTNAENGGADTLEEIQAALKTEKDPLKAGQLAAKAKKLRENASSPGRN